MNDDDHARDLAETAIEAGFGHRWRVWRSDTGRWWAARSTPPTAAGRAVGCVHFLRADDPAELARSIHDQEQLQGPQQPVQTTSAAEEPHE